MKGKRLKQVTSYHESGNKVVFSLKCGHSVTQTIGYWWGRYDRVRELECPRCHGFKSNK